jgi:hypothetical protein
MLRAKLEVQMFRKTRGKEFTRIAALRAASESSTVTAQNAAAAAENDRKAFEDAVDALILKAAHGFGLHQLEPEVIVAGIRYIAIHGQRPDVVSEWIAGDPDILAMMDRGSGAQAARAQQSVEELTLQGTAHVSISIGRNVSGEKRATLEASGLSWNGRRGVWWGEVGVDQIAALQTQFEDRVKVQPRELRGAPTWNKSTLHAEPVCGVVKTPLTAGAAEDEGHAGLIHYAPDAEGRWATQEASSSPVLTQADIPPPEAGGIKDLSGRPYHEAVNPEPEEIPQDRDDMSRGSQERGGPHSASPPATDKVRRVPGEMSLRVAANPFRVQSGSER